MSEAGEIPKVLLIDDSEVFVEEIRDLLDGSGIGVEAFYSLEEANGALREEWLAVLLDMNIPPHDPLVPLTRARTAASSPIIAVTGLKDRFGRRQLIREGAAAVVFKHDIQGPDRLIETIWEAHERHLRELESDQAAVMQRGTLRVLQAQSILLQEIAEHLRPSPPIYSDLLRRLGDDKEREKIGRAVKDMTVGLIWFLVKMGVVLEILRRYLNLEFQ